MATPTQPPTWERYIAIDLHKEYLMIGGIDTQQRLVIPPRRLDLGSVR